MPEHSSFLVDEHSQPPRPTALAASASVEPKRKPSASQTRGRLCGQVVAAALPSRRIHVLQAARCVPPRAARLSGTRMTRALARRYSRGGFIEPHDDAAYVDAVVNGQNTLCSREVAIILYLTEGWDASYGGALIDHKVAPPRVYVPEFNSVVVFKVVAPPVRVRSAKMERAPWPHPRGRAGPSAP